LYLQAKILTPSQRRCCYFFNSFFYKKLLVEKTRTMRDRNTSKWTKGVDIFSKQYLIIPINVNHHWTVAVVCFPNKIAQVFCTDEEEKKVVYSYPRSDVGVRGDRIGKVGGGESVKVGSGGDTKPLDGESGGDTKALGGGSGGDTKTLDGGSGGDTKALGGGSGGDTEQPGVVNQRNGEQLKDNDQEENGKPISRGEEKQQEEHDGEENAKAMREHDGKQSEEKDGEEVCSSGESTLAVNSSHSASISASKQEQLTPSINKEAVSMDAKATSPHAKHLNSSLASLKRGKSQQKITPEMQRPCILLFDSLSTGRAQPYNILKDYLLTQWNAQHCSIDHSKLPASSNPPTTCRCLTRRTLPLAGLAVKVPQQPNEHDCGLFILTYVELFLRNPFRDLRKPDVHRPYWFDPHAITEHKRKQILGILQSLRRDQLQHNNIL